MLTAAFRIRSSGSDNARRHAVSNPPAAVILERFPKVVLQRIHGFLERCAGNRRLTIHRECSPAARTLADPAPARFRGEYAQVRMAQRLSAPDELVPAN